MPLSPDVQGQIPLLLKRPRPSLSSEDPNEVYYLTEESDVVVRSAKLPRSSSSVPSCRFENPFPHPAQPSEDPYFGGGQHQKPDPNSDPVQPVQPSEYPDVQGGQHQNTDPVQPAKPSEPVVRRTLKEILDESPPNLSFERDPKYASLISDWKVAEERAPSSIVWKYYGPGEGSETVVVDASKRRRSDSPFGITYETAATDATKRTHPDTPFWNTFDSLVRKTKEASKNLGKDSWKQIIEDQKRNWQCHVCLKSGDHMSLDCPYLEYLPEGATVAPGIKVVCSGSACQVKGEHDNTKCFKHAVRMS